MEKITLELIKDIYSRAEEYYFAKTGNEATSIEFETESDDMKEYPTGNILVIESYREYGEWNERFLVITPEELNSIDLPKLIEERLRKQEEQQLELLKMLDLRKKEFDDMAKNERYQKYLELKKEFENE